MMKIAKLKIVGTVKSYTLNKQSEVLLSDATNADNLINKKINNIKDGSIVSYIDTGQYCCLFDV